MTYRTPLHLTNTTESKSKFEGLNLVVVPEEGYLAVRPNRTAGRRDMDLLWYRKVLADQSARDLDLGRTDQR